MTTFFNSGKPTECIFGNVKGVEAACFRKEEVQVNWCRGQIGDVIATKAQDEDVVASNAQHLSHGTRTCIKGKKMYYGKFFDFCAEKCIQNQIPRDQNPPMKGF